MGLARGGVRVGTLAAEGSCAPHTLGDAVRTPGEAGKTKDST